MSARVSERAFEEAIEAALLEHGPDAVAASPGKFVEEPPSYHDPGMRPGGYHKRRPEDYDRALCLLPHDILDFVLATRPRQWRRLSQHHGAEVRERFLKRLSSEIDRRGALDGLGARAGTCIDPRVQIVEGKGVCVVSCQRSPEPVFLTWKGVESPEEGDFFVRSGPGTVKLTPDDAKAYVRTRFGQTCAP